MMLTCRGQAVACFELMQLADAEVMEAIMASCGDDDVAALLVEVSRCAVDSLETIIESKSIAHVEERWRTALRDKLAELKSEEAESVVDATTGEDGRG